MSSTDFRSSVALPWLLRLRWLAVAGQGLALVLGANAGVDLPYATLGGLVAALAGSNLLLAGHLRAGGAARLALVPALLTLDTLLFTGVLYLSGGPDNPFSLLYVVHVAMAAVVVSTRWTWWIAALSAACYASLFRWSLEQPFWHQTLGGSLSLQIHMLGMWISVTIVAAVMTYFIGRIMRALREREDELARTRGLAARNERLAALTTLAAGAAHELGSPLGTIAVAARELELTAPAESLAEDARLIREQVDRCRGILDRMSARTATDVARVVVRLSAAALEGDLRSQLGAEMARVKLTVEPALEDWSVPYADLVQALGPLIQNALDASESGDPVEVSLATAGERLDVWVTDRGRGMSREIAEHAGEPFFTTKAPGRGTGLGLFVVRLVTERLGGRLSLDSRLGHGTTAHLELPLGRA